MNKINRFHTNGKIRAKQETIETHRDKQRNFGEQNIGYDWYLV